MHLLLLLYNTFCMHITPHSASLSHRAWALQLVISITLRAPAQGGGGIIPTQQPRGTSSRAGRRGMLMACPPA